MSSIARLSPTGPRGSASPPRRVVPARAARRGGRVPRRLLGVPLDSRAVQEFAAALIARPPDVLATVPDGDVFARDALVALGAAVGVVETAARGPPPAD